MSEPAKKRGRPFKNDGDARTIVKQFRVNVVEDSDIEEQAIKAGYSSFADYARAVLSSQKPRQIRPRKSDIADKLLLELNRIGVNLNQQTAHSNSGRHSPNMVELTLIELREVIAKVGAAYDT
jgi:hypothetical protein